MTDMAGTICTYVTSISVICLSLIVFRSFEGGQYIAVKYFVIKDIYNKTVQKCDCVLLLKHSEML